MRRSVSTASATPGYWTLTATGCPSRVTARWTWPIEAAANASSSNEAKTADGFSPSSERSSFSTCLNGQRRDVVAQRRERLLEALALVLGQRGEVDRREHLPDLHRRAAHLAELLDELARERRRALAGRLVRALGRADDVRGARPDPAGRLPGDEPAETGGAGDPGRGWLARLWHAPERTEQRSRATIRLPREPARLRAVIRAFGPGRVNLIGEHTDYNGGPRAAVRDRPRRHRRGGAARRRGDRRQARDLGEHDRFAAADPGRADGWRAFVRGTVAELRATGVPLRGRADRVRRRRPRRLRALLLRRARGGALRSRCSRSPARPSPTASSWRSSARGSRTTGSARRPACSTSSPRSAAATARRSGSTSPRSA